MSARETVARQWHEGSDHAADGEPFGGPLCNCHRVAKRMLPMLAAAWNECVSEGEACGYVGPHDASELEARNPYETQEPDRG